MLVVKRPDDETAPEMRKMRRGYLTEERGGGGLGSGGRGGGGRRRAGVGGAEEDGEEEDAREGEEEGEHEAHPPRPLLPPALERRPPLVQERPPPHRTARPAALAAKAGREAPRRDLRRVNRRARGLLDPLARFLPPAPSDLARTRSSAAGPAASCARALGPTCLA